MRRAYFLTIIESTKISPFSFLANLIAKLDLPEAVGPAKSIIFLGKTS